MERTSKPLFLDGDEVEQFLNLDELIEGIEKLFSNFSSNSSSCGYSQPQRQFIPVQDDKFFLVKPAYSLHDKTLATKLLTLYPNNEQEFGLPNLQSIVILFDSTNGCLEAILDGISVTDLRTAAASAVAVKHLCPHGKKLAIIGCGHQGVSHIKLLRHMKQFDEIRVYSRNAEKCKKFANEWDVVAYDSVETMVADADVIVTATSSKTPVLFHKWVKSTALVVIVGAPEPTSREVDDDMMLKSQIITDSFEAAHHCGDVKLSGASVTGEIGNVIQGCIKPDVERTRVFKSNGMALQDLIAGRIVVENYKKQKEGRDNKV